VRQRFTRQRRAHKSSGATGGDLIGQAGLRAQDRRLDGRQARRLVEKKHGMDSNVSYIFNAIHRIRLIFLVPIGFAELTD
jgi:hypothetical protein